MSTHQETRNRKRFGRVLLLVALVLACGRPRPAAEVLVFAAVSLTDALEEIAADYGASGGGEVRLNLGPSSFLARQIEAGAAADLLLAADEATMDRLAGRGLVLQETRRSVLSNTLVIVVPAGSTLNIASPQDLAAPRVRSLALAEPEAVPAGIYAKQYLRSQGLWSRVAGKVIPAESVRAALVAVQSLSADAGIVYKTDARIADQVRIAYEVSAAEGPRISYPFAVMAASEQRDAARRFLAYLESPAALKVFRRHGFLIVDGR